MGDLVEEAVLAMGSNMNDTRREMMKRQEDISI